MAKPHEETRKRRSLGSGWGQGEGGGNCGNGRGKRDGGVRIGRGDTGGLSV